jgi:hypothetical protein
MGSLHYIVQAKYRQPRLGGRPYNARNRRPDVVK